MVSLVDAHNGCIQIDGYRNISDLTLTFSFFIEKFHPLHLCQGLSNYKGRVDIWHTLISGKNQETALTNLTKIMTNHVTFVKH